MCHHQAEWKNMHTHFVLRGYFIIHVIHLVVFFRVDSLALGQSGANIWLLQVQEVALRIMGKIGQCVSDHRKAAPTMCLSLSMCCSYCEFCNASYDESSPNIAIVHIKQERNNCHISRGTVFEICPALNWMCPVSFFDVLWLNQSSAPTDMCPKIGQGVCLR